jgi:hypothetical protein
VRAVVVVFLLGSWLGLAASCARTLPATRPASILFRDLERVVTVAEAAGWDIDRLEVDGVMGDALKSLCRVPRGERELLLVWLDGRIAELGGPVDEAWRARGKRLDAVDELLTLTRIRLVLEAAMEKADADCPFWMEPSAGFRGRQISDDRWQLELQSGGKGIVTMQGGEYDVTGGGVGRLMITRNLGMRWALSVGGEIGAGADFEKNELGERNNLVFGFDLVAPVVLRWRSVNTFYELEVGPLGHFTETAPDIVPGVHVGVAVGAQYLRQRWFLPGAAFAITYERTFPDDDDALHVIKIGVRVGLDVDL